MRRGLGSHDVLNFGIVLVSLQFLEGLPRLRLVLPRILEGILLVVAVVAVVTVRIDWWLGYPFGAFSQELVLLLLEVEVLAVGIGMFQFMFDRLWEFEMITIV